MIWKAVLNHLRAFTGGKVAFKHINELWLERSMTATFIMSLSLNEFIVFLPFLLKRSPKRVR